MILHLTSQIDPFELHEKKTLRCLIYYGNKNNPQKIEPPTSLSDEFEILVAKDKDQEKEFSCENT